MDCIALQAPLSMEFSRQEYLSGLPFPSPGDLPKPGIEPGSLELQADSLPSEPPGKPTDKSLFKGLNNEWSYISQTSLKRSLLFSQEGLSIWYKTLSGVTDTSFLEGSGTGSLRSKTGVIKGELRRERVQVSPPGEWARLQMVGIRFQGFCFVVIVDSKLSNQLLDSSLLLSQPAVSQRCAAGHTVNRQSSPSYHWDGKPTQNPYTADLYLLRIC